MALNKVKLQQELFNAFKEARTKEANPEDVFNALAGAFADAIDEFVKELQITYTTGLTAPNGAVTGAFGYTLN